jgi:hypothetical protein
MPGGSASPSSSTARAKRGNKGVKILAVARMEAFCDQHLDQLNARGLVLNQHDNRRE